MTIKSLHHVTHNYLGHSLGWVMAETRHDAIVMFARDSGMALAALVASKADHAPVKGA